MNLHSNNKRYAQICSGFQNTRVQSFGFFTENNYLQVSVTSPRRIQAEFYYGVLEDFLHVLDAHYTFFKLNFVSVNKN